MTTSRSSATTAACPRAPNCPAAWCCARPRAAGAQGGAGGPCQSAPPVLRYGVVIGTGAGARSPAGSWVHERLLSDATRARPARPAHGHRDPRAGAAEPLTGYTFEGLPQRRRLAWARATSWPSAPLCNAWRACSTSAGGSAFKTELLPQYPERRRRGRPGARLRLRRGHRGAGCRVIPIRTLRHLSHQPQLRRRGACCSAWAARSCSPSACCRPAASAIRARGRGADTVRLQDRSARGLRCP